MMEDAEKLVLMNEDRVERSLKRIAYQIAEHSWEYEQVLLLGIDGRGYAVAAQLQQYLDPLMEGDCLCRQLLLEGEGETQAVIQGDIPDNDYVVVLVDDVIFSGSTMFRALTSLAELFTLSEIHTAVLVDRGHRKFPIEAEFVGMDLPTKLNELVSVEVKEDQQVERVMLYNKET